MPIKTEENRTLAFAGMLQALQLVNSVAYGRPYDVAAYQASLSSILAIDSSNVEAVYGGIDGVRSGLHAIKTQLLGGKHKPDADLTRYLVTLLHLEGKLRKRRDLLDKLRAGIERAQGQHAHYEIGHPNLVASLADTYSQTLSTLQPRIMVKGDPNRLSDSVVANQIRALLLAAIRSAVLWRQCGGTRPGLLFGRKRIIAAACTR